MYVYVIYVNISHPRNMTVIDTFTAVYRWKPIENNVWERDYYCRLMPSMYVWLWMKTTVEQSVDKLLRQSLSVESYEYCRTDYNYFDSLIILHAMQYYSLESQICMAACGLLFACRRRYNYVAFGPHNEQFPRIIL